jgi:hypothetical protein
MIEKKENHLKIMNKREKIIGSPQSDNKND